MKTIAAAAAILAAFSLSPLTAPQAKAGPNEVVQLVILPGLCPDVRGRMSTWALGKKPWSAYALPTAKHGQMAGCGFRSIPATPGTSTGQPTRKAAHKAALAACNAARPAHLGKCVVVGTIRVKK